MIVVYMICGALTCMLIGGGLGVIISNARVFDKECRELVADAAAEAGRQALRASGVTMKEATGHIQASFPAPGPEYEPGSIDDPAVWEDVETKVRFHELARANAKRPPPKPVSFPGFDSSGYPRETGLMAACPHCKTVGHTDPDCPQVVR